VTAVGEGKISKTLKKFLTDEVSGNKKLKKEQLVVSELQLDPVASVSCSSVSRVLH
jgi:nucleolar protein 58